MLHRLWQLLLKGYEEVVSAARPLAACEMALLRLVHAADMPDPGELAHLLKERGLGLEGHRARCGGAASEGTQTRAAEPAQPAAPSGPALPPDFGALVALLLETAPRLAAELHDCVSLVHFAPPALDIRLLQPLDADFTRQVAAALKDATGEHWIVNSSTMSGEPSLREQQLAAAEARREEIRATPIVAAALAAFPGAALCGAGSQQLTEIQR